MADASTRLRAPDPTLDALSGPVGVDYMAPHPAVAHATLNGAITGQTRCGLWSHDLAPASYARWFAVPCRECFPDAPPPGHDLGCHPECASAPRRDPNLAWQTEGHHDG